ncbi:hypothetical protein TIFTF001_035636 [Ficus carica]|uniref:Uncharacterized protein n=1 Tax=Ficus carica TaxID=3494 RepID=A0AA88E3P9_FICCA|nr:hypothetical protein TIFTF001_035636 [Ficus carica]
MKGTFRSQHLGLVVESISTLPFSVRNSQRCPFFNNSTTSARRALQSMRATSSKRLMLKAYFGGNNRLLGSCFDDRSSRDLCHRGVQGSDIPLNLGKTTLPNLEVIVLVIRLARGVSRTPPARSSNPRVEPVALWSWEVNHCSILVSNVLISSDIMFLIIASIFIVPGGTGPSGDGDSSYDERQAVVDCEQSPVFPRDNRQWPTTIPSLDLSANALHLALIAVVLGSEILHQVH